MASKLAFLLLALFALVLLISSEATARDLAKPSSDQKNGEVGPKQHGAVDDAKYDGYGGYPGGGYNGGGYPDHGGYGGGYPGSGGYGGGYPGHGGYGGGYPGHGGYGGGNRGYCRYGCCGGQYGGGCRRCCSYAGEAVDAQVETEPHN